MKNFKQILVLFFVICFMQLNAQSTDFEKIAVGAKAEFTKWSISEQRPLIIVNGIEIRNKSDIFNRLDPNDIEQFEVLKDEKAIEKYGSKAIDGVILVTLKKDKFPKYRRLLKSNAKTDKINTKVLFDKDQYGLVLSGIVKGIQNQTIPKVVVTNLTKKEVYYCDSLGNYKVNIAKNDLINFSKKGFESQKIRILKDTTANIILKVQTTSDAIMVKKPVIYLYPKEKTEITISIDFKGKLLTTFPKYDGSWNVTAYPDGQIFDKKTNRLYSSLFWDGSQNFPKEHYNYQSGFVVFKNDLTAFLIEKLDHLGLNTIETNEFIQFWLPFLEKNEINFIHFYVNAAFDVISKNIIFPKPDTEIRVFMEFYGLDKPIEITEQKLQKTERKGFIIVEWGGSDVIAPMKEINSL